MSTASIRVSGSPDGGFRYQLSIGDRKPEFAGPKPDLIAELEGLGERLLAGERGLSRAELSQLLGDFVQLALPGALQAQILRWAGSGSGGPLRPPRYLVVDCEDDRAAELPWEVLPGALGLSRVFVARLSGRDPWESLPQLEPPVEVLVAGWTSLPARNLSLPGIERELSELPKRLTGARVEVEVLPNPALDDFVERLREADPHILHLAPITAAPADGEPSLVIPDDSGEPLYLSAERLVAACGQSTRPSLIVLNTCRAGLGVARVLSRRLAVACFGWAGDIQDLLAADFAPFFYQRLLEGDTPAEAIRRFQQGNGGPGTTGGEGLPVFWVPAAEALDWRPFARPVPGPQAFEVPETGGERVGVPFERARAPAPEVEIVSFKPLEALNPALVINGRPPIEHLSLMSSSAAEGLRLAIECDTGGGSSIWRQTLSLVEGPQPIATTDLHFPVLYQLVAEGVTRRRINFLISVSSNGRVLAEETRSGLWMSCNEWMDRRETWPFIPAFVQRDCEAVREILGKADVQLKIIDSPTSAMNGYQSQDPAHVDSQMRAIYQALRDQELSYIGPPGPVYTSPQPGSGLPGSGSALRSGQMVRFPDEVLEHRRGTCHDLTLFLAACAERVGIHPLVILIRGHTFLGYWRAAQDHRDFWTGASSGSLQPRFGQQWLIDSKPALDQLVEEESVRLIEATRLTRRECQYGEANEVGAGKLNIPKHRFDVAVDVSRSRRAIQPL